MSEIEPQYGIVDIVSPAESFDTEIVELRGKNKKEITQIAKDRANYLVENGEDTEREYAQAEIIKTYATEFQKALKSSKSFIDGITAIGKGGVTKEGVTLTYSETGEYDYSSDPVWQRLNDEVEQAKKKLKEHQELLKKVPVGGKMMLDESTGEMYRAYRPVRLVADTIKATIK